MKFQASGGPDASTNRIRTDAAVHTIAPGSNRMTATGALVAGSTAHLQFPIAHRCVTRTTNLLEFLFGEECRRSKMIPHACGERAVTKLMCTALICARQTWRVVSMSYFERKQLETLRHEHNEAFNEKTAAPKADASRSAFMARTGLGFFTGAVPPWESNQTARAVRTGRFSSTRCVW